MDEPEYGIGFNVLNGFAYDDINNIILFAMCDKALSGDEVIAYVADSIVHEYLHHIIFREFGVIATGLFDAVGHHFRDYALLVKYTRNVNRLYDADVLTTYPEYITRCGFGGFLSYQRLYPEDVAAARQACSKRSDSA